MQVYITALKRNVKMERRKHVRSKCNERGSQRRERGSQRRERISQRRERRSQRRERGRRFGQKCNGEIAAPREGKEI